MAIPDYTLRLIAFDSEEEAYYVAAVLNSSPVTMVLHATSVGVQTQRYHAGDIDKLKIPTFQQTDALHLEICELSRTCHAAAADEDSKSVSSIEAAIDSKVAKLWRLTSKELSMIQAMLQEIKGK